MDEQQHPGYRAVAYFVNWAIYGRNHQPQDLPANTLTHVLYAFANVRPESGEVYLTDPWSDTDKHYPTDSWNDTGTNVYGCIKQLFLLKKRHRHLKVLLSIGGWTYSSNFVLPASTLSGRQTFAKTAVQLVQDLGLDGLDIDWEYPQNEAQGLDFAELLKETRAHLNAASPPQSPTPLLTIATPAGAQNYEHLPLPLLTPHLSFYNLMAYDYAGSWSTSTAHQANLHSSLTAPAATPFSTSAAVSHYLSHSVPASKLVIGCPLYGRAFGDTASATLGAPFHGTGEGGSWEQGVWDFKALPLPGAEEHVDEAVGGSWSYDQSKKTAVSYDNVRVAEIKARWIEREGLGGAMWWESSGDRKVGGGSLIEGVVGVFGAGSLEKSENRLEFKESKYENLRKGFPGE